MCDCSHDWTLAPGWGVFIGLSKCRICGKVAESSDFPAMTERNSDDSEKVDDTEAGSRSGQTDI